MSTFHKHTLSLREVDVQKKWYVIDAAGKTLGRLASEAAHILRGKHKPQFTPHIDAGDFVVVINASQIRLTGKRESQKQYYHNTYYPGGARWEKFVDVQVSKPEFAIEHAVKGMLPKNSLGRRVGMKLKVYPGAEHPHTAQNPAVYQLKG